MKPLRIPITILAIALPALADIPNAIPQQGRVAANGANFDGTGQFKFLLFGDEDASHSSGNELAVWSNAATTPADMNEPATAVSLTVTKGLYGTWLGDPDVANMAALPAAFDPSGKQLYLRIWFDDGSTGFQQLSPDQKIAPVPYALLAQNAEFASGAGLAQSVEADAIGSAQIQDGAIEGVDIANGTIASDDLMPGAVSQLGTPDGSTPGALQLTNGGTAGLGTTNPAAGFHVTASSEAISPTLLSELQIGNNPNSFGLSSVAISSNGLLAAAEGSEDRLQLYSTASPTNPVLLASVEDEDGSGFDEFNGVVSVRFLGPDLLAAVSFLDNAVTLIDVSAPNAPTVLSVLKDEIGGFTELEGAYDVAYEPSLNLLAIVSKNEHAVTLVDISNPSSPQFRAVIKDGVGLFTRLQSPMALAFNGSGLLAITSSDEHSVTFADVSTPGTPVFQSVIRDGVNGFDDLERAQAVAFRDAGLVAVCGRTDRAVSLISVSDPANPALLSVLKDDTPGFGFLRFTKDVSFDGNGLLGIISSVDDAFTLVDPTHLGNPGVVTVVRNRFGAIDRMDSPNKLAFGANGLVAIAAGNDKVVSLIDLDTTTEAGLVVEERVGIGVDAPQAALHVAGNLRVEGANRIDLEAEELNIRTRRIEIGENAVAKASGDTPTFGVGDAIAIGVGARATGDVSTALGSFAIASGTGAIAIGYGTTAPSFGEIAIGQSNTRYTPASATSPDPSDRLLVIGNGSGNTRSDQLIIYKNGLLEHDGAMDISGSVIADDATLTGAVVAATHKFPSVQTFTFNVPGNALIPSRENEDFFHSALGYIRLENTDTSFAGTAPVTLPQGATITGYDLMFYDNSTTQSFTGFTTRLRRRGHTTSQTENIAQLDVPTPSSPDNTSIVLESDDPALFESGRAGVNNNTFAYFLSVDFSVTGTDGANLRCYGFRVRYTLDTLLP